MQFKWACYFSEKISKNNENDWKFNFSKNCYLSRVIKMRLYSQSVGCFVQNISAQLAVAHLMHLQVATTNDNWWIDTIRCIFKVFITVMQNNNRKNTFAQHIFAKELFRARKQSGLLFLPNRLRLRVILRRKKNRLD